MQKKIFYKGASDKVIFRNTAFKDLAFNFTLIADAVNTLPSGVDMTKVRAKAILRQNGIETVIFDTNLQPLQAFGLSRLTDGNPTNYLADGYSNGVTTTPQSVSVAGVRHMPCVVDLVGLVLKGSDTLTIEVSMNSDCFHTDCDASSYMTVYPIEAEVKQYTVPKYDIHHVQNTSPSLDFSGLDNVNAMIYYSADNVIQVNTFPVTNIKFSCNKKAYDITRGQLVGHYDFENYDAVNLPIWKIVDGFDYDDVNVNISLDTSNVTNGKNFVIIQRFYVDGELAERQEIRNKKHNKMLVSKILN